MPFLAAESAVTWAANGVLFRDPLKPALPADSQAITAPSVSVRVAMVLLKDVLGALPSNVALDVQRLDRFAQLHDFVLGQVLDLGVRIDPSVGEDLPRSRRADAVDISEADLDPLVSWNVYACYSGQFTNPAA